MTSAPKLLGSVRLKLRVALASFAVLVTGSLIAPRATQTALSPPPESAAPLLEQHSAAREVVRPFEGVQQVLQRIHDRIVAIPGATGPGPRTTIDYRAVPSAITGVAGFGIFVTPAGDLLTHEDALDGRTTLRVDAGGGSATVAEVVAYEPPSGLVLMSTSGTAVTTPSFAAPAQPGALVAAYVRVENRATIVPAFITDVTRAQYSIAATAPLRPGTPVYNLSGELLAIVTGGGDDTVAVPAREAVERLVAQRASGAPQPASLGLAFQPLDGPVTGVFGQTGALVADVIAGGPAAAAGIEPGDLVLAVGDAVVQSPEAAHKVIVSLPTGSPASVRVRRDDRVHTLDVRPSPAFDVAALIANREAAPSPAGVAARDVLPVTTLNTAGVPLDAVVISINKRPVSALAEAIRELRRNRPSVLLYVEDQDGKRFFAVVDPPS